MERIVGMVWCDISKSTNGTTKSCKSILCETILVEVQPNDADRFYCVNCYSQTSLQTYSVKQIFLSNVFCHGAVRTQGDLIYMSEVFYHRDHQIIEHLGT